ncbi:hypothetical protein GCM10023238_06720 [Streptomyces heliomycini]
MYSATARELEPGAKTTGMPRSRAAATSMVSVPTPCLAMTLSRGAASMTSAVTGSMPATSASAPDIRASSSSYGRARSSYGRTGPAPPSASRVQGSGEWRAKVGVVMRVVRVGVLMPGPSARRPGGWRDLLEVTTSAATDAKVKPSSSRRAALAPSPLWMPAAMPAVSAARRIRVRARSNASATSGSVELLPPMARRRSDGPT